MPLLREIRWQGDAELSELQVRASGNKVTSPSRKPLRGLFAQCLVACCESPKILGTADCLPRSSRTNLQNTVAAEDTHTHTHTRSYYSHYPVDQRYRLRVLLPGAGLGRLTYDIAKLGFSAQVP